MRPAGSRASSRSQIAWLLSYSMGLILKPGISPLDRKEPKHWREVRRGRARQLPADALASVATVNLAPDDLISTDRVQSIAGTHLLTFQYS